MKRFTSRARAAVAGAAFFVAALAAAPAAQAALTFVGSPGAGAPPATLGEYTMVPSPQDTGTDGAVVSSAPATPTSSFSFDNPMLLYSIGPSWNSSDWAGGTYAGRVYDSQGATETVTLASPSNAVYFYATPDQVGSYDMAATATGTNGTTVSSNPIKVTELPAGAATPSAQFFGFYGTGGEQVQSITISLVDTTVSLHDFAIGDFALAGTAVDAVDDDLALSGVPSAMTVDATSPAGAVVTWPAPTAVDEDSPASPIAPSAVHEDGDATATVACSPASGSTFAIGVTTVTCTATDPDDSNSPVSQSFTVTVEGAAQQLSDLAGAVVGVGPGKSLANKVAAAQKALASGKPRIACRILRAFIQEVRAQPRKRIPAKLAASLIADAKRITAVIGCAG